MLQAESDKLRQAWIQAVQASIASAYRESPDTCCIEVSPDSPFNVHDTNTVMKLSFSCGFVLKLKNGKSLTFCLMVWFLSA